MAFVFAEQGDAKLACKQQSRLLQSACPADDVIPDGFGGGSSESFEQSLHFDAEKR